uniref:Uncharacterized protein n=1 Tax=Strongyloides papillosus TaxID=174720 RepID=A0A0N5B5W7_STREA
MLHYDCPKKREKKLCWKTFINNLTGRVFYQRRDNTNDKITLGNGRTINNSFVVLYNVFLLKYFNGHINIEIVNQVLAVTYLFKYFVKDGETNKVNIEVLFKEEKKDEICEFQKIRCVEPTDATWRIFEYPIVANTVTVEVLYIHLKPNDKEKYTIPLEENDFFNAPHLHKDSDALMHLLTTKTVGRSKLMAYFQLMEEEYSKSNPDNEIQALTYELIPTLFKWDPLYPKDDESIPRHQKGAWIRRVRKTKAIGRIVRIAKANKELFAMRTLLIHRKGIKSFVDLRTIDGIQFSTFDEAAKYLNLTDKENLQKEYFDELGKILTSREFINAFSIYICQAPEFKEHKKVFDIHKDYMNQIFIQRYRTSNGQPVSEILAIQQANSHLQYEICITLGANGYDIKKSNLPFGTIFYPDIINYDGDDIEEDTRALQKYIDSATKCSKTSL